MSYAANAYLTGQQAAAYLGRSDEWLRLRVNAGLIRYSINPTNGRKVYSKVVLDRFTRPVSVEDYLTKTVGHEECHHHHNSYPDVRRAARRKC